MIESKFYNPNWEPAYSHADEICKKPYIGFGEFYSDLSAVLDKWDASRPGLLEKRTPDKLFEMVMEEKGEYVLAVRNYSRVLRGSRENLKYFHRNIAWELADVVILLNRLYVDSVTTDNFRHFAVEESFRAVSRIEGLGYEPNKVVFGKVKVNCANRPMGGFDNGNTQASAVLYRGMRDLSPTGNLDHPLELMKPTPNLFLISDEIYVVPSELGVEKWFEFYDNTTMEI